MSKVKVVIAALIATLALSAVAVSAASAAQWYVAGSKLVGSAKLATSAAVDKNAILSVPKLGMTIECTGPNLKGVEPEIIAEKSGKAKHLIFEACSVTKPTNCKLVGQPTNIETNPIEATVALGSGKTDKVTFSTTSANFVEVNFAATELCALEGLQPIKGQVTVNAPTGQEELTLQAIEGLGTTENHSLEIGKASPNKAYIEGGKALLKLESGSKWSFH